MHSSTRVAIEHTFGLLKQRFRQLFHLKVRGSPRICHVIKACCVLHNLSDFNELEDFAVNLEDLPPTAETSFCLNHVATPAAKAKRLEIVSQLLLDN